MTMQWVANGNKRSFAAKYDKSAAKATVRSKAGIENPSLIQTFSVSSDFDAACALNLTCVPDLIDPDQWESTYPMIPECVVGTPTNPPVGTPPPVSTPPSVEPGVIYGIPKNVLTIPMVYGSPMITLKYGGLFPFITTPNALLSVNGDTNQGIYTGNKFVLIYNTGNRFVLYILSGSLTFTWTGSNLTSNTAYTGIIRLAVAPTEEYDSLLEAHLTPYAIAGKIDTSFTSTTSTYTFNWITEGNENISNLMMLTLPHQRDSMLSVNYLSPAWRSLKGAMIPILGNVWTMVETLTSISWDAPTPINPTMLSAIENSINSDLLIYPAIPSDVYTFGKVSARYARLVLISDQIGNTVARDNFLARLITMMTPWMEQTNLDNLLYDTTWGGIVSSIGLANSGADYGLSWYNDQHFQYGYFLYSCAVIAKYSPTWATAHKSAVDDLARSIGNPSTNDPYFPVTRMKDWFCGHSWAAGLFSFGDIKDQESTSEAVNGYYGLYLWGMITDNIHMTNFGKLLLATEIRSAIKYWHMFPDDQSIYLQPFTNNTCIGILWNTKANYATWFGLNVEYIHCIQMLPYTPMTEELLPADWIQVEYPVLATALTRTKPVIQVGWTGFIYMTLSIINQNEAWNLAQTLTGYDNGNSQSNTLYFIATRPT